MEIHLKVIGGLLIFLSLVHVIFLKYFNWKEDLAALSLNNREMMWIHTLFIAFTTLLMGALCLFSTEDMVATKLGRQISLGFGIFWGVRLVTQFFGYSAELWKGKLFETVVHVVFSVLWFYLTVVFLRIYWEILTINLPTTHS